MSKKLKSIGLVSGLTVVSRVLGLLRDQLGAAIFGTTALNSAFVTAFRIPNLFRRLLGEGALTAAFIPALQEELTRRGKPSAFALVNQVCSWLLLFTGLIVGVAMLACSQARLWTGEDERWYIAADLSVFLFPYLILICLAAVLSATLNVMHRFSEGALSPVLLNLSMIAALGGMGIHFSDTPLGRMHWLCGGVLVGGALQLLLPAASLFRQGWRPCPDLRLTPGVREIALLMLPGLWGAATYQINQLVIQGLAMSINDSAASLLFYSGRLMELPIGVFAIAISTVVYPLLSKHAAEGNHVAMGEDYLKGVRLILLINIPAALGLALLCEPIVRLLFERGLFTAADTAAMGPLLALAVVGLPFFSVVSLSARAFYAIKDTATPVRVATVAFAINLILAYALRPVLGVAGLVLASTVSVIVQSIGLQVRLSRKLPSLSLAALRRDLGKIILASLAMGLVVAAGWWWVFHGHGFRGDLGALLLLIPASLLVYGLLLRVLRVGGLEEFTTLLSRLGARFKSRAQ